MPKQPKKRPSQALILGFALSWFALAPIAGSAEAPALWKPHHVFPRSEGNHIPLNGSWNFTHLDSAIETPAGLAADTEWLTAELPATIHWALHRTGKYPYPYAHLNSRQYDWINGKIWYFQREFETPAGVKDHFAMLCFDGVDYFSRVWVNGVLLGRHEGQWGGPVIDVTELLQPGAKNSVTVEVKSANIGNPDFEPQKNPGRIVKSCNSAGAAGAKPFFTLGIWKDVRLELLPKLHLSKPFVSTTSLDGGSARLRVQSEIYWDKTALQYDLYPAGNRILWRGVTADQLRWRDQPLQVVAQLIDGEKIAAETFFETPIHTGRNWLDESWEIPDPKLWWPNGMAPGGTAEPPHLYRLRLSLRDGGRELDRVEFDYGIRTVVTRPSAGPRLNGRWRDHQFVVNGRPLFVKGVNWMPADLLLDLPESRYRWLLETARDAGIQMIRVWGGGHVETDTFYRLCDELGVLVWQDFTIWHQDTPDRPVDVWQSMVCHDVFRLRNHPSLALWCGGNGFNPYSAGSARTVGVIERCLADHDPDRLFLRTSSDAGNAHIYPDMDPTLYERHYLHMPYLSETGMHCVANAETLESVIDPKEFDGLGELWAEDFQKDHPEFLHHFVEYEPSRVPRMLSRASHIDDMRSPTLASLAEASQIGAGEFYQVMSEGMQSLYPVCTGIMPWVYKRPWPVVSAIMLLDGFGQPVAPYYFLRRTYEPAHVALSLPSLLLGPGEQIPVVARVIHSGAEPLADLTVTVRALDEQFRQIHTATMKGIAVAEGPSVTTARGGTVTVPADEGFVFLVADLHNSQGIHLSRSVYWPRILARFADPKAREKDREAPHDWPAFESGPWLKPGVARQPTTLGLESAERTDTGIAVTVRNTGAVPAFPVKIDIGGIRRVFRANDNFFWLDPGESRRLELVIRPRDGDSLEDAVLAVDSWNAGAVRRPLRVDLNK